MALNSYVVRFEGNDSRKWDGKEVYEDKEVLDELYDSSELVHGAKISYPWRLKGSKLTHWNAIFVDPMVSSSAATASSSGVSNTVNSDTGASCWDTGAGCWNTGAGCWDTGALVCLTIVVSNPMIWPCYWTSRFSILLSSPTEQYMHYLQ